MEVGQGGWRLAGIARELGSCIQEKTVLGAVGDLIATFSFLMSCYRKDGVRLLVEVPTVEGWEAAVESLGQQSSSWAAGEEIS